MPRKGKRLRTWFSRATKTMEYHGRRGKPMIHLTDNLKRAYIMVRAKGGGTKRLYLDTKKASSDITHGLSNLKEDARRLIKRAR